MTMARLKAKGLVLIWGILVSLLLSAGTSLHQSHAVTVAFGGDTLFGGYYHSSDPNFGTMDDLAQVVDSYIQHYGEAEGRSPALSALGWTA